MHIIRWLNSLFSTRGKALALYRRGMARANKHDHLGAIEDYAAALEVPHSPADVKAMALYNRALAYSAVHDDSRAIEDLNRLLAMAESPADIKTEARRRLERMKRHASKTNQ